MCTFFFTFPNTDSSCEAHITKVLGSNVLAYRKKSAYRKRQNGAVTIWNKIRYSVVAIFRGMHGVLDETKMSYVTFRTKT